MIVIYNKPRILTLCCRTSSGIKSFDFVPGRNNIAKEDWDKIISGNRNIMQNCHMCDFEIIQSAKHSETNLETAKSDTVDIDSLTGKDLRNLIEGTLEPKELKRLKEKEESRIVDGKLKKRQYVLDLLDKQIEKVAKIYG